MSLRYHDSLASLRYDMKNIIATRWDLYLFIVSLTFLCPRILCKSDASPRYGMEEVATSATI